MTALAWLRPAHTIPAGIGLLLCPRTSGRAVLPALLAVAVITAAALVHP